MKMIHSTTRGYRIAWVRSIRSASAQLPQLGVELKVLPKILSFSISLRVSDGCGSGMCASYLE